MAYGGVGGAHHSVKALIVAPAWVGDMVMAHTLVQSLVQQEADAEVHLLAPPATASLGLRMPGVAEVHELPVGHGEMALWRRLRMGLALRPHRFDAAYVLPNSLKSALAPWWARIPRRTGWLGEARYGLLNDWRRLDPSRHPQMAQRFLALGQPPDASPNALLPQPVLQVDAAQRAATVSRLGLSTEKPVVALCPGAEFGPAKRWPAAHFAALAQAQMQAGRSVWLFGSPNDRGIGASIAALAPGVADLTGRTSLLEAVDLLSLAEAVVANDSGLMHVANALSLKVVALYGASSQDFTPPLNANARVLAKDLDCRPCLQRTCPLGHLNCLRTLKPDEVADALNEANLP